MIKINGKPVNFETFPNGETRLLTDIAQYKRESSVQITFKYENDSDLIKLLFVKKALDKYKLPQIRLLITYMPYSRMDRSENGSPFTLKYVADFINDLYFDNVTIVEPHSDVSVAVIEDSEAYFINFDLLPQVMRDMNFDKEVDYIFFPDAGAAKRYHSLLGYKQLVGHKQRDFETGDIQSFKVVGEIPENPGRVLIVDDLSSYGGTFVHSQIALEKLGFKETYLLVAHAENSIFQGKLFDHIMKVYTTDSILSNKEMIEVATLENRLEVFPVSRFVL